MKPTHQPSSQHDPAASVAPSTPADFVRRYLAELEQLEERRKQDAIARRLRTLPDCIRRNP